MKIENVEIYGIKESFKASKYPMMVDVNSVDGEYTETREGTKDNKWKNKEGIFKVLDLILKGDELESE